MKLVPVFLKRATHFVVCVCILSLGVASTSAIALTYDSAVALEILVGSDTRNSRLFKLENQAKSFMVFPSNMTATELLPHIEAAVLNNDGWAVDFVGGGREKTIEVNYLRINIEYDISNDRIRDIYPIDGHWGQLTDPSTSPFSVYAERLPSMKVAEIRLFFCTFLCPKGPKGWYTSFGSLIRSNDVPKRIRYTNDLTFHVYDVGGGNCVVAECPADVNGNQNAIILDCGVTLSNKSQIVQAVSNFPGKVPAFLNDIFKILETKNAIDIILTHADLDHYNLLPFLFLEKRIGEAQNPIVSKLRHVYAGGTWEQYNGTHLSSEIPTEDGFTNSTSIPTGYATYKLLEAAIRHAGATAYIMKNETEPYSRGSFEARPITDRLDLECGDRSKILAYNAYPNKIGLGKRINSLEKNGQSIIAAFEHGGKRVVMPGDATAQGLVNAVNNDVITNLLGNADVLLVPHHGSGNVTHFPANWMNKVNPKKIIFSAGLAYGHPTEQAYVNYLSQGGLQSASPHDNTLTGAVVNNISNAVYSTFDDGDLVINIPKVGDSAVYCVGPWLIQDNSPLVRWCTPQLQ